MIRVLVADDHAVVRHGVVTIVDDAPDLTVAGEACTGRQVLQEVEEHDYDVLLLDISMPDGSGLEVLKQMQSLESKPNVLILSMYPEEQYAMRALKAGAAGYLTKGCEPAELLRAIRKVAQGRQYVSQSLAEKLVAELTGEAERSPSRTLSSREYQVMRLLSGGKTVTDIARELSLSVKTVSTYRSRVLKKLNLRNTAEIIRYAFQHGVVEWPMIAG